VPSKNPQQRFHDIVENADRILEYTSGLTYEQYESITLVRDAVERCFERIGEAAVKLGLQAEALFPSQPWKDIRGLDNNLRHEYDNVSSRTLWLSATGGDIASLRDACKAQSLT
jgi:uncharacterized protein with HEPN domain